jgi:hypothetical protein
MTHTLGPWTAFDGIDGTVVCADNIGTVANIPIDLIAHLANARLIAAAPDILGALRELVERAEAEGNTDGLPEYDQARAAIAKAQS